MDSTLRPRTDEHSPHAWKLSPTAMHHTEQCSRDRARSNQIGFVYEWKDLSDLPCARRLLAREGAGFQTHHRVRAVQRTVPMGDRNATDFSQVAHLGVLRAGGACRPDEFCAYRGPVPRGDTWEATMIDDHIVTHIYPRHPAQRTELPARDEELLRAVEGLSLIHISEPTRPY